MDSGNRAHFTSVPFYVEIPFNEMADSIVRDAIADRGAEYIYNYVRSHVPATIAPIIPCYPAASC